MSQLAWFSGNGASCREGVGQSPEPVWGACSHYGRGLVRPDSPARDRSSQGNFIHLSDLEPQLLLSRQLQQALEVEILARTSQGVRCFEKSPPNGRLTESKHPAWNGLSLVSESSPERISMSTVKLWTDEEVAKDARVKAVFDDIRVTRKTDFVNNFWRALANQPAVLERTWASLKEIMVAPGVLDPLTKELIYIAVSTTNGCSYCVHSHTAAARAK